jgi:hypothetical protein
VRQCRRLQYSKGILIPVEINETQSVNHLSNGYLTVIRVFTTHERCWYFALLECDPMRHWYPDTALSPA